MTELHMLAITFAMLVLDVAMVLIIRSHNHEIRSLRKRGRDRNIERLERELLD